MFLELGLYSYELYSIAALLHPIDFVNSAPSLCGAAPGVCTAVPDVSAQGSLVCRCCNALLVRHFLWVEQPCVCTPPCFVSFACSPGGAAPSVCSVAPLTCTGQPPRQVPQRCARSAVSLSEAAPSACAVVPHYFSLVWMG